MSGDRESQTGDVKAERPHGAAAWSRELLICLGLVVATLFAFGDLWGKRYEFFNIDDGDYVTENPQVKAGLTWKGLGWALTTFHSHNWHPLTWASLQLDVQLFGTQPWGFRLTNVLLHAANAVLLFWVLRRMTGAVWRSAFVAGLFALHPLHVESVAWVAERKDVLSAFFYFLTLAAYARYAERPSAPRYALVLLAFAAGLMAKPMLVTLPFALLLLDYWPLRRLSAAGRKEGRGEPAPGGPFAAAPPLRLALEKVPLLVLAAGACVLTLRAQRDLVHSLQVVPLGSRVVNALVSYLAYLRQAVWPDGLAAFYPHPEQDWSVGQGALAGLVLGAVTFLAWHYRRPAPYGFVGWFWYVGTLVPVIGIVQVGMQARADRYTYLPLVGPFLIVSWGAPDLLARWRFPRTVFPWLAGGALAACAVCTWRQVQTWQSSVTVWEHAAAVVPGNKVAHNNLGLALLERGKLQEAGGQFEKSLEIDPAYDIAAANLSTVLLREGHVAPAVGLLARAVRLHPENAALQYQLGKALLRLPGRQAEAAQHLRAALAAAPDFAPAREALGVALLISGEPDQAIAELTAALDSNPRLVDAQNWRGLAYLVSGRPDRALPCFAEAVRLAPDQVDANYNLAYTLRLLGRAEATLQDVRWHQLNPDWPDVTARQAAVWATHPDPKARNGRLALLRARMACAATEDRQPLLLDVLAACYAELGQFEEAVKAARKAHALALSAGQRDLAGEIERHLRSYQNHKPAGRTTPGAHPD